MPIIYQVTTGNWLHRSKKIYETVEECYAHIRKIEEMKEDWVTNDQSLASRRIIMIDTDELPEYQKIFKEKLLKNSDEPEILPPVNLPEPKEPTEKEIPVKPPGRPKKRLNIVNAGAVPEASQKSNISQTKEQKLKSPKSVSSTSEKSPRSSLPILQDNKRISKG